MADLSLDELVRRRGISTRGTTRPIFRTATGGVGRMFDARQKIGVTDIRQRTGARGGFPLKDAREKLVQKDARFQIRGGPTAGGVQDARQTINSRKQQLGQKPLHSTAQLQSSSQGILQTIRPQIQILNQSSNMAMHSSADVNSAQGLHTGGGAFEHGGGPNKLMDARDRLSLKRSIAVALPTPGSPSAIKITKTIQQRPVGMTSGVCINVSNRDTQSFSGEDDVFPSKQMKPGVGSLFTGPITKVVKNDSYTAPPPPVPDAPPRTTPALPASRSAPSVLKAVSRTLVTGQAQQGEGSGDASSHPATVQPARSPLEGTKMTVNNLHPRVTEEDIVELFCVCGALKRARLVKVGVADVVFVRKDDAVAAYRKYNNRYLDGQPMKCNLHIQGNVISSDQPILLNGSQGEVRELFSQFGPIQSVELRERPGTAEPTESKLFKYFTPTQKEGFKVGYIVFKNGSSVTAAKSHPPDTPLVVSTEERPVRTGLQKWIRQYSNSIIQPDKLQADVDSFMQEFDKKKEESEQQKKEAEKRQEEDEEGWVKVTRGVRGSKARPHSEAANQKALQRENRKKKRKELLNFYSWQHRNTQREHIAELRRKFEEDKQRIAMLRSQRKFRPY
ncbi:hypothetical protein SKAU_G00121450 [Synaphobranchus kaupii]|uniref:RRM domain-containing protein n=1 Tax=Synaphobranchus kaupii TaxID=118154 RepID=A0A9Q1FNY6_SYNKA|nr:hypothetical protein SKAU_G00121450 [Synaphobranchus kaupii]